MEQGAPIKRLLVFSDLTGKQINGVVKSYEDLHQALPDLEYKHYNIDHLAPAAWVPFDNIENLALPLMEYLRGKIKIKIEKIFDDLETRGVLEETAIHVATAEFLLGRTVTQVCRARGLNFTTAYHTQFPEYISKRYPYILLPKKVYYDCYRLGHRRSHCILSRSEGMMDLLRRSGFRDKKHPKALWRGALDAAVFRQPAVKDDFDRLDFLEKEGVSDFDPKTEIILLFVGRISPEKNPKHLLGLAGKILADGRTIRVIMVGEGEWSERISKQAKSYVHLVGKKSRCQVRAYMWAADALLFSSTTDTLGLVQLESLACGTPVVAAKKGSYGARSINLAMEGDWVIVAPKKNYLEAIAVAIEPVHVGMIEEGNQKFLSHYCMTASAQEFMSHQVPAKS